MRDRVEHCSTCGANLTDCCNQCLVCVEAGRIEGHPCTPGGAKLGRRKTRAETREAVAICLHSFDGYAIEAGENWGECDEERKGAFRYQADAVLAVLAGSEVQS